MKQLIKSEDLNPDYFKNQASAIIKEFNQKYTSTEYVIEKLQKLNNLAYIVCRNEYGRNSPEVGACVVRMVKPSLMTSSREAGGFWK